MQVSAPLLRAPLEYKYQGTQQGQGNAHGTRARNSEEHQGPSADEAHQLMGKLSVYLGEMYLTSLQFA